MKVVKSAGAVIFRRSGEVEFLLLKYGAGHWDLVKGHIEEGEDEVDTIHRETQEETGISEVEVLQGFREAIDYHYRSGNELVYKQVAFYLAETCAKEVELSQEHVDYCWLPFSQAYARLTYENAKRVLKKAHEFLAAKGMGSASLK